MVALIVGVLCMVAGGSLALVVLVRKLPALAELQTPAKRIGFFQNFPIKHIKGSVLSGALFSLNTFQRFLRSILRLSERMLGNIQTRTGSKAAGFLLRARRRQAYLEEEKKLLNQLAQEPNDLVAYKRLGNLYTVAGNTGDARAAFQQALKINPEDEEAQKRLEELSGT